MKLISIIPRWCLQKMKTLDFSEEVQLMYSDVDPKATCRTITFQVTEDCCLKCTYCYQIHKTPAKMSTEVAKQAVDLLFKLYDEDNPDMVINHHTYGIVLDLIGGEPFMNIEVMDFIMSYFIEQCVTRNHIWLTNFRASISTNGLLYFEPKVQDFLNKYHDFISLNVTLDGPKDVHDLCRIDHNNEGSFDRAYAAWNDWYFIKKYNEPDTKVTISPENLPKMGEIFDFFFSKGCTQIHANPIFEHCWTIEEAREYYKILIQLADKLLEMDNASSSLFAKSKGHPLSDSDTNNYCGGTSAMLAFDPQGKAYPCLRYMASSLGPDRAPIVIGDTSGIYNTPEYKAIYDDMQKVTRQSQSTEECLECPVASGCAWCSAENYNEFGTYNKRSTNICWMHRAESLAVTYYWNTYYRKHDLPNRLQVWLPPDPALEIVSVKEYNKLLLLS